eukprot:gene7854-9671_t
MSDDPIKRERITRVINGDDDLDIDDSSSDSEHSDIQEGMCDECRDQPHTVLCSKCEENLCENCAYSRHSRGIKLKQHMFTDLKTNETMNLTEMFHRFHHNHISNNINNNNNNHANTGNQQQQQHQHNNNNFPIMTTSNSDNEGDESSDEDEEEMDTSESSVPRGVKGVNSNGYFYNKEDALSPEWFLHRSQFIPIRLSLRERSELRLLEAALHVSEYTDKIDIIHTSGSKLKRINEQLRLICAILSGLLVANDFKKGQKLVESKDFVENEEFFARVFEIGRRHKIMNPAKMRTEYGKLIHLLQDASQEDVKNNLSGLNLIRPLHTVYSFLEERGGTDLLRDPLLELATREILAEGKARYEIQREIREKERAIKQLANKHSSSNLKSDDIEACIYSIGDNHTFLRENRDSVKKLRAMLKKHFDPNSGGQFPLTISMGTDGARLNHNHKRQYHYVNQTLSLWKEILHDMFQLWKYAEDDLLMGHGYRLSNTGQGLNRIQQAPRVAKLMNSILYRVQQDVGDNWIGSSVIHLGDHNVPNALTFIDKYTQISRILNPIIITIEFIPKIKDPNINEYIRHAFGSKDHLIKTILSDFFKHAFDGSGSDNFFDAGSCIDGRLTSAWNWCSQIEKKPYYSVFLLAGFVGFDGSFN